MKFQFNPKQQYQLEAISAVTSLFKGQTPTEQKFGVDKGRIHHHVGEDTGRTDSSSFKAGYVTGYGNKLTITDEQLNQNLKAIQKKQALISTYNIETKGKNFSVEMETGTGKTYTYLRTLFELNKQYGFSKFIIVVPSIAVREGVLKSLQIMKSHFKALYDQTLYEKFIYQSKKIINLRDFATGHSLQIMIINIDAFNKDKNIIHSPRDNMGGLKPIEYVQATQPILIIDEAQNMESEKSKEAICSLNPLCTLRYSATHKNPYNLIYRLSPVEAFQKKLVKKISVLSIVEENDPTKVYIKVLKITNKNNKITCTLQFFKNTKEGRTKTKKVCKQHDDLFVLSNENSAYKNGFKITEINCTPHQEFMCFANGIKLTIGQEQGGAKEDIIKAQIRETIKAHFEKESQLKNQGIKVLSLFFLDRVENYRIYKNGQPCLGTYGKWFEQIYTAQKDLFDKEDLLDSRVRGNDGASENDRLYGNDGASENDRLYGNDGAGGNDGASGNDGAGGKDNADRNDGASENDGAIPVEMVHNGYFSKDKKGAYKNTQGNSKEDQDTYSLIMRDKEKLLDINNPLKFIFSHSALREGWDNPNIFQICTLNESHSPLKKRQEIGRGLRLPVNQKGDRIQDTLINQLIVVANESYKDFVSALQKEIEEECGFVFGTVSLSAFSNLTFKHKGQDQQITLQESKKIWEHLQSQKFLSPKGNITEEFNKAVKENRFLVPEKFKTLTNNIIEIIEQHQIKHHVQQYKKRKKATINQDTLLDPEFKKFWNKISQKTIYSVHYDSKDLVEKAGLAVKNMPAVSSIRLITHQANIAIQSKGVSAYLTQTPQQISRSEKPVLPDILDYMQKKIPITKRTIFNILKTASRWNDFEKNPQKFMDQVVQEIQAVLQSLIIEGIKYEKLDELSYEMSQFLKEEHKIEFLEDKIVPTTKSVYDYIYYESKVEKDFAVALENLQNIKYFIKLPKWFKVKTPVGDYNPDWAILKKNGNIVYMIRETKGTLNPRALRSLEQDKTKYGKKHFESIGVDYKIATSVEDANL